MMVVLVPLVEQDRPDDPRVWWGMAAGLFGAFGVLGLYRALSAGSMTVVAPLTGLVAAALPVAVGLALGERPGPMTMIGLLLALAAVALIGGIVGALHQPLTRGVVLLAVGVGAMFGGLFIAFSQTGETGLWPLLTARVASLPLLTIVYLVARRRERVDRIDRVAIIPAMAVAVLIALANGFYLVSTREGLLAVVAVLVSLYPASTVALAMALDGERATKFQLAGMVLAVVAVAAITV